MELRTEPTAGYFEYLNSEYTPDSPPPAVAIAYHANVFFTHRRLNRWIDSIKDGTT